MRTAPSLPVHLLKSPAVLVWVWFLLSLMVFYSGHLYSNDALAKLETARSLVTRGTFAADPSTGAWGNTGRGGKTYPHFSIGSILLMVPPVAAYELGGRVMGKSLPPALLSALISILNVFYTACTGAIVFVVLVFFGKSRLEAFTFANIVVFSTEILPYSSTGWSEPAAFLAGLAGFVLLITDAALGSRPFSRGRWVVWGGCAAFASLVRIEYTAFFVIFVIIWVLRNRSRWRDCAWPVALLALAVFVHLAYNKYRYEDWFVFGYFNIEGAHGTDGSRGVGRVAGIIGRYANVRRLKLTYWLLLSFGKSHFVWASPLVFLAPATIWRRREVPKALLEVQLAAALFIPLLGYNSWCWGNRYFYVILPYLILPLAFVKFRSAWARYCFWALTSMGLFIAVAASLVNYHVVMEEMVRVHGYHDVMQARGPGSIAGAPFWLHLKFLPHQLLNTARMFAGQAADRSWEALRTTCLDVWPVGLVAMGVKPVVSLGLWLANVAAAVVYGRTMVERLARNRAVSP